MLKTFFLLSKEAEAAEDKHPHDNKHEEEAELLVAGLHGVGHGLQPHRAPGQLEHSHHPSYAEHLNSSGVRGVSAGLLFCLLT